MSGLHFLKIVGHQNLNFTERASSTFLPILSRTSNETLNTR